MSNTSTIESTNLKIIARVEKFKDTIDSVRTMSTELQNKLGQLQLLAVASQMRRIDELSINMLHTVIHGFLAKYNMSVISILIKYYSKGQPTCEHNYTAEYNRILASENYCGQLDSIESKLTFIINTLVEIATFHGFSDMLSGLGGSLVILDSDKVKLSVEKNNYDICKCGARMVIVPEQSYIRCLNGCQINQLVGTSTIADVSLEKAKISGFASSRHCKKWLDRLQARELNVIPDEVKEMIKYVITTNGYIPRQLTCKDFRTILKHPHLKAVKGTKYNENIPTLMKIFAGKTPPQLDYFEEQAVMKKWNRTMELLEQVEPNKGNKPYYPGYIYKIIKMVLKSQPDKLRLLDYIHLQSPTTVAANDVIFEKICNASLPEDELYFEPTDPLLYSANI